MSKFKKLLVQNFTIEIINECIVLFDYDFGKIAFNLTKEIADVDKFITYKNKGICYNYNEKYESTSFYYINSFVSKKILGLDTEYPIPLSNGVLWDGESLENRIAYMTFVRDFLLVVDNHHRYSSDR